MFPHRLEDTASLCGEAASSGARCSGSDPAESTAALLQTFALVESQDYASCGVGAGVRAPASSGRSPGKASKVAGSLYSDAGLQDSSFEVISLGSRSSSGFCEKWAGPEKSNDTQQGAEVLDSSSCFLHLDSRGEVITHAMADLDLNRSAETPDPPGDLNASLASCDTAELLRTPSPCVVESDPDTEPEDRLSPQRHHPDPWTPFVFSKGHELDPGLLLPGVTPTTSTPKKPQCSPSTPLSPLPLIQEGSFQATCYHRDGTPIGMELTPCCCLLNPSVLYIQFRQRTGQTGKRSS